MTFTTASVPFVELTPAQLYGLLTARSAVFVVEQNCVYQDMDGVDAHAIHLITSAPTGEVAAYARVVPPGVIFAEPSIGRVLTSSNYRRQRLGYQIMERAIAECESRFSQTHIRIAAQRYLIQFYARLGFQPAGPNYEEDGIPHVHMLRSRPTTVQ